MAKIGVFTFKGPREGQTIKLMDRYQFVDGVFKANATDALLMEQMLCTFNGCELTWEDESGPEVTEHSDDGSLAKKSTKGMTAGEKLAAQDLAAKLNVAEENKAAKIESAKS